eukprot:gene1129-6338_t
MTQAAAKGFAAPPRDRWAELAREAPAQFRGGARVHVTAAEFVEKFGERIPGNGVQGRTKAMRERVGETCAQVHPEHGRDAAAWGLSGRAADHKLETRPQRY